MIFFLIILESKIALSSKVVQSFHLTKIYIYTLHNITKIYKKSIYKPCQGAHLYVNKRISIYVMCNKEIKTKENAACIIILGTSNIIQYYVQYEHLFKNNKKNEFQSRFIEFFMGFFFRFSFSFIFLFFLLFFKPLLIQNLYDVVCTQRKLFILSAV